MNVFAPKYHYLIHPEKGIQVKIDGDLSRNGMDFVGPCINISTRLQKMSDLSFAFSARGVDLNVFHPSYHEVFVKKQVAIRGIGDNELIYISREGFDKLPKDLKG